MVVILARSMHHFSRLVMPKSISFYRNSRNLDLIIVNADLQLD